MTIGENKFGHSCPFHPKEMEESVNQAPKEQSIKDTVYQTGHSVFQAIGNYCPYAKDVTDWARNSFSYYYYGNIPTLYKIMRIGDTETFERYKEVSLAHKLKSFIITDPELIEEILSKFRDGNEWSGGPEFAAVRYVIGGTTPLTETDKSRQSIVKSFTMNNHFSPAAIKGRTLDFITIAKNFVENTFHVSDNIDTYNISEMIPEYTLKVSARVILGVETDYSELIQAIGALENLATDMILFKPNAFIPNILDSNRTDSKDRLKTAVSKIVNESKDGQGITAKMSQEVRYTDSQAKHFEQVRSELTAQEGIEKQQVMNKIYDLISSRHYQSHFFEIAEQQEYNIPLLRELSELKREDLRSIDEGFFRSLKENGELEAFLNILSLMIASKDNSKFDKEQIADIVKTVLIIGSGTTKSAIISSIYCLLKNPEEQKSLYQALQSLDLDIPTEEELESITEVELKSLNDTIYEKIMKCPELDHFVNEVLRMFPPIAAQARLAKQDVQVKDLTIPSGRTVVLANILANNDASRWQNPTIFNPSRFADPATPRIHPFNYGINQCMGRFQALSSIKAIIYTLVMKYKILPPLNLYNQEINQDFILSAGVALKFDKPLWARFEERG